MKFLQVLGEFNANHDIPTQQKHFSINPPISFELKSVENNVENNVNQSSSSTITNTQQQEQEEKNGYFNMFSSLNSEHEEQITWIQNNLYWTSGGVSRKHHKLPYRIQQAIFSSFSRDSIEFNFENNDNLNSNFPSNFSNTQQQNQFLCVLLESPQQSLQVYDVHSGQDFLVVLPCKMNRMWTTPFGLFFERKKEIGNVEQQQQQQQQSQSQSMKTPLNNSSAFHLSSKPKKSTNTTSKQTNTQSTIFSPTFNSYAQQQHQSSTHSFYSLRHPLEEVRPIIEKSEKNNLQSKW